MAGMVIYTPRDRIKSNCLSKYSEANNTAAQNRKSWLPFFANPRPSSLASRYQTGVPFFRTLVTICSDSVTATRWSFLPATTRSGYSAQLVFMTQLSGVPNA